MTVRIIYTTSLKARTCDWQRQENLKQRLQGGKDSFVTYIRLYIIFPRVRNPPRDSLRMRSDRRFSVSTIMTFPSITSQLRLDISLFRMARAPYIYIYI